MLCRRKYFPRVELLESRIAPAFITGPKIPHLNGLNGFRLDGVAAFNYAGGSVSGAGDINGDGYDDLIVGTGGLDATGPGGATRNGWSYVVFGRPGGFNAALNLGSLDGTDGFRLDGFGASVSGAGDLNGDGFDDLIAGNPSAGPHGEGAACVLFGKARGFAAVVSPANFNGTNGFRMHGVGYDGLGRSVSGAGDINGDGLDDVIIGTDRYDSLSYVVFGRATGFAAVVDLTELDGANGFRIDGPLNKGAGTRVSEAGDINGDGFADLVIGGPGRGYGTIAEPGSSYVIFGKANGFQAVIDLSNLDGTDGFRIDGIKNPQPPFQRSDFGSAVSGAGDINGDGFDDILIGDYAAEPDFSGAAFVIFGKSGGFAPVINAASLDGTNGFRIDGSAYESATSVSWAGDVNGDGVDDAMIGAGHAIPNGVVGAGSAFVIFGRTTGFDAVLSLATIGGPFGFRLDGVSRGRLGTSVSAAGDINGDGFDDVIVGADQTSPNGKTYAGSAYVVFGQPTRTVHFAEADGDILTVRISLGTLKADNFTITPAGTFGGGTFTKFDLGRDGDEFAGADITITAKPGPLGGDGLVDLGFLDAGTTNLGKIILDGNVGRVNAGAVIKFEAKSLGVQETAVQSEMTDSLESNFDGNVGVLKVDGSIHDSAIHVTGDVGRLKVGADLERSLVTVLGEIAPNDRRTAQTIGTISIGRTIGYSQLLVGYNTSGNAANPDVRVGRVEVGGDWVGSDLIVGAKAGTDNLYGTNDDLLIENGGNDLVARIAAIVIRGSVVGTADETDHYGIVAESIGSLKVGAVLFPFTLAARNDLVGFELGSSFDLRAREAE